MMKGLRLWARQHFVSAAFCRELPQYATNILRLQWRGVVFPRCFSMALAFSSVIKGLTAAPERD
jgi:hypothetical protein